MKHFDLSFKLARRPNLKNSPRSLIQVPVPRVSDRQGSQQPWTLTFWNPKVVQSSSLSGHFFLSNVQNFPQVVTHRAPLCTRQCASPVQEPRVRWLCVLGSPPPVEHQKPAWCWPNPRPHCLAMETRPSSWPPPHHNPDKTSRLQRETRQSKVWQNGKFFFVDAAQQKKPKTSHLVLYSQFKWLLLCYLQTNTWSHWTSST